VNNFGPIVRRILPEERPALIEILEHGTATVSIMAPVGDNNCQQLGVDLYETFKAAKWKMKDPIVLSFEHIGGPVEPDIMVSAHGTPGPSLNNSRKH
jgi:hypothetical protein